MLLPLFTVPTPFVLLLLAYCYSSVLNLYYDASFLPYFIVQYWPLLLKCFIEDRYYTLLVLLGILLEII